MTNGWAGDELAGAQRRSRLLLMVAAFGLYSGLGAALPVLSSHIEQQLAASEAMLGVALGTYAVATLLGRLPAGWLADRLGCWRTASVGLLLAVGAGLLHVLGGSGDVGVAVLLTARVLHGLAAAGAYTAIATWALNITPEEDRSQVLGLLAAGVWTGYTVGPLAGAALGDLQRTGALVVVVSLVGLVALAALPPAPHRAGTPAGGLAGLVEVRALLPGLAVGLVNGGSAAFVGFLVPHLAGSGANAPLALSVFAGAVLLSRVALLPRLRSETVRRRSPYVGALSMVTGLLLVALADRATLIACVAGALLGFGLAVPWPMLAGRVAATVPGERRGAAVATMTALIDLSIGATSFLAGLLAARSSTTAVFLLGAALVSIAVIPMMRAQGARGTFKGSTQRVGEQSTAGSAQQVLRARRDQRAGS